VAIGAFLNADGDARGRGYSSVDYGGGNPYSGVQDVFVYDQGGKLVTGARMFDQDGQPIELGNPYCTDETTGEYTHTRNMGYPYCPQEAPFRMPSASASASTTPSATAMPSATATPPASATPSGSADPSPSASVRPSPSAR
jgi:hypothetical protein